MNREIRSLGALLLAALLLSVCAPRDSSAATASPATTASAAPAASQIAPPSTQAPTAVATAGASPAGSAVVVFVKDGDVLVWDEATGQTRTIFDGGDAIAVTMSDDGQVVAFLRRSVLTRTELDWYEQSALWGVDPDGQNARELVSTDVLRGSLNASETDSTNFPQLEWIPGTHRLLYSGWRYLVQAEGESHAVSEGLFLVDADSLTNTVLVPAGDSIRFVPSPDGQRIALISASGLGFVGVDGSERRQDVLTYTPVGIPGPLSPTGVWTQDAPS